MKTWKAKLKRGFSLFLAFTMCLSMLQLTVLAVDENSGNSTANHTHHAEGWICTPYCDLPEHTHTEACYHMAENEEAARTPVTLPDDVEVNDGTSTTEDDFGNEYKPPEIITWPSGEGEDEIDDNNDDSGITTQPEGPADGEEGEPTTQPAEPEEGEPTTQPAEPEEGEPTTQPAGPEEGEPTTQDLQPEPKQNGTEVTIPETNPPQAGEPELQCGMVEHKHTDACAEKPGGGWYCVPDTNITINVPENRKAEGRVDLLEGVTTSPRYCGNWPIQIAVAAVTTADGEELEAEDGQWLTVDGGVVYNVEYVAYVDAVMTLDADSDASAVLPPDGVLAQETGTVEGEKAEGDAKIGDKVYEKLAEAMEAVQNGDTVTVLRNVTANFVTDGKSYTLDLNGHELRSETVGQNVVTILNGTVTVKNGIITGGDDGDRTNQDGKGVLTNNADVTLENCVITGNSGCGKVGTTPGYVGDSNSYGGCGGGVYAYGGSLTLTDCTVSENESSSKGGGIYARDCAVTMTGTKVQDNNCGSGSPSGGGIQISGGSLTIDDSTISGNIANNGYGNAIALTGANVTVTIKNSEISSTDTKSASVIYAEWGKGPIDINLENVDVVNKAGTNTSYAIYSLVAGTFTAKDCTFHDSNGSIQLTKATEQSYENCQFLNIDATNSYAGAPVYLKAGNASFTNCTFTGNKGYNAGGIYNATTGTVTIDGCLFNQNSGTSYSAAGAIYVAAETNTTVTNTVVKENTTSGTNSSGPAGGISVSGAYKKTTNFTMISGAVYNNKSEKQSSPAHDIYVYSSANAKILAAKDMADGDKDFSNYTWSDLTRTVIKEGLTQSGNWTANNTPEYVATVDETQYKTLDDAYEAARLQSRKTGEPVTVNVVEGYVPLGSYWGVSQKPADGPYAPSVTLHLNNTHVYGINNIKNSFSIGEGSTLTLSGTGTLNKNIYMMGGTLNIDGNVVVTGSSLAFNQGPIYDNKTATTAININGNVDQVQIALYRGTVTVGENAHVGKMNALMTTSSGQILETNFVMNGQVDELNLNQVSSKSTATLNGHIGTLNLGLGTEIYGTRTFPTTTAGENFSVDKLSVAPSFSSASDFEKETGRTSDGLVSTVALSNPAQPVADLILIHGGGGKVGTADWTTTYSMDYNGKSYKFLTTVESVDGNIVLHKTVVDGNYVLLDGEKGLDSNDGLTLETPVKTFERAKAILKEHPNIKNIHVLGTITVSDNVTEPWTLDEGQSLVSFPTFNGELVKITNNGKLTLGTMTIDGAGITRDVPLIENKGALNIDGATIKGGVNTVIYGPNNGQGIDGGAVYNSGTLTMTGGSITGNSARTGSGVFSKGKFILNGGDISGNHSYGGRFQYSLGGSYKMNSAPAGGGVFLAGGTMEMNDGLIENNTVNGVGGGIALGNETNAYTSYGGPKLIMNNGTINNNFAVQGGGMFIQKQCTATINGGYITNNEATGGVSVATGYSFLYGGGGIYVNGNMDGKTPDGKLYLQSPAIIRNTADSRGGGIAGCPSANVDLKVDDGGVIVGNTVDGSLYDIYVELGLVIQPDGSQHKGGHFYLSKYMPDGTLYNWTYQVDGTRVPMQDVYYFDVKKDANNPGVKNSGFYSAAALDENGHIDNELVTALAGKCSGVTISGNHSTTSGGGIGTNGLVEIGKNPDLDDFFSVTVNKKWLDPNGKPMDEAAIAELKGQISKVEVDLYRRPAGGSNEWELVDTREITPDSNDFWYTQRPFHNLLKVLDGKPLEYQIVERVSLTGEWSEIGGGVIEFKTPDPITADNAGDLIDVEGKLPQKTTADADIDLNWEKKLPDGTIAELTGEELENITKITVEVVTKDEDGNDATLAKDSWTKPEETTPEGTNPEGTDTEGTNSVENPGVSLEKLDTRNIGASFSRRASAVLTLFEANETDPDAQNEVQITINADKKTARITGLPKPKNGDVIYTVKASYEGNFGMNGTSTQMLGVNSNTNDAVSLEFTNQLQAPVLTLVKKIDWTSSEAQTFKFTVQIGDKEPVQASVTIPAGAKEGVFDDEEGKLKAALNDVTAGTKFTVTETAGKWNPTWNIKTALDDKSGAGLATSEGTLCYGENTVTFLNLDPNKLPIPVTKHVTGDKPESIPDFSFELSYDGRDDGNGGKTTAEDDGIVMPESTTLTIKGSDFGEFKDDEKLDKTVSGAFDSIKFTKEGFYPFTVRETPGTQEGWTYSGTEWKVVVHVTPPGGDGKLNAKIDSITAGNDTADSAEFINSYEGGKLTIKKEVSGGGDAAQNKVYTFTVTSPNGYSERVTITKEDNWEKTLTGLTPDNYTVVEDNASIDNFNWSVTGNNVTVEVKAKETSEVTIVNTYAPPPPPPGGGDPDPGPGPGPGPTPPPTPDTPINPEPTPLTELPDPNDPESPEEVTVIEEDVPKTYIKTWDPEEEEYVYVPEDDVPLGVLVPKTGDNFGPWAVLFLTSAAGLAVMSLSKPKKKEETD